MKFGLAEGFKISQFEKQMSTNYLGVVRVFKEIIPNVKKITVDFFNNFFNC